MTWWRPRLRSAPSFTSTCAATPSQRSSHAASAAMVDFPTPTGPVAAWAGHSVEMLRRVYAGRADGLEGVCIARMAQTLPQEEP
jgi:hypothetical protein